MVIAILLLTVAFSLLALAGLALGYMIGVRAGAPEDLELGAWQERRDEAMAERRAYGDTWIGSERW